MLRIREMLHLFGVTHRFDDKAKSAAEDAYLCLFVFKQWRLTNSL